MQEGTRPVRQRGEQIQHRRGQRERRDRNEHALVVVKEMSEQAQQHERDGERVEEHEHRHGIVDDLRQADVGDQQRHDAEHDRPRLIAHGLREQHAEDLRAARDKADGRLEAGERHRNGEDDLSGGAEIVSGDIRKRDAAVGAHSERAAALRADDRHGEIDEPHKHAREHARAHGVARDGGVVLNAQIADDAHNDHAERQRGKRVHRIVAVQKTGGEGAGGVCALRRDRRNGSDRLYERRDNEHGKEHKEQRVDDPPDPCEDLARAQREEQHEREEDHGEYGKLRHRAAGEHRLHADGKARRGAAGDRKKRADRQIQRAGKEHAVPLPYAAAHGEQIVRTADAERRHAYKRQTYRRNDEAKRRNIGVRARELTHMHREYQVPGAEKQPEQHARHGDELPEIQFLFHISSLITRCKIILQFKI